MWSLGKRKRQRDSQLYAGEVTYRVAVLPRFARKPARVWARLLSGEVKLPRYTEASLFSCLFLVTALYGSILGGQLPVALEKVTMALGFEISEVKIEGHENAKPEDMFAALDLTKPRSLVLLNSSKARDALAQLPWIEKAQIRKVYPSKLIIDVVEREPYAIWQMGDALSVIEENGDIITGYEGALRFNLPLFVGNGAASQARSMNKILKQYPDLVERIHAHVRVGERRWDLRLKNGLTLKLPEFHVKDALNHLVSMNARFDIFDRDIATIDMRIDDRTIISLTENAYKERQSTFSMKGIEIKRLEDKI